MERRNTVPVDLSTRRHELKTDDYVLRLFFVYCSEVVYKPPHEHFFSSSIPVLSSDTVCCRLVRSSARLPSAVRDFVFGGQRAEEVRKTDHTG